FPLVFVRPPDTGAFAFAGRKNPIAFGRVFTKGEAAEPAGSLRCAGVIEIDCIDMAGFQGFGEIYQDGSGVPRIFQDGWMGALESRIFAPGTGDGSFWLKNNFVNLQVLVEIQLDARVILQHAKANRILAADEFLFRIDANIQVIEKQVVV